MNKQPLLIRQFNQITLFLLGTLLIFSCVWAYFSNQALTQEASTERANYIAGAISDSMTHAMEVGVPLTEMRGVDVLLRARANENENIHHIAILNLSGAVMWEAEGGVQEAQPVKVTADVRFRDQTVAYAQVSVYPTGLAPMMINAIFLQIVLCVMAYAACYETMIFALGRGIMLREQAKSQMRHAILQGQLNTITIGQNRSSSDRVLYGMVLRLRRLNEKIWRMRRLTASLRITEPDADMRAELDATLARAEGKLIFADRKPESIILSSYAIDTRWLYFITCVGVESLLQVMVPDTVGWMSPLLVLLGALGAIAGLLIGYKLALRKSGQFLVTLGSVIIAIGAVVVGVMPLTLYSVLVRFIIYMGATILVCGCYGVVKHARESQAQWPIAAITGGLLVGRLLSLLAFEWFGSKVIVVWVLLLVLLVVYLTNKFSWGQTDFWRRPIGKLKSSWRIFSPVSLCNGILSGLLFSFALATFVFNEGYGNEMMITLSWLLLGVGAWAGYQLPARWRVILWVLALACTGALLFEHQQTDALSLLFCFSVSALEWHTRQYSRRDKWWFDISDLGGIALGAGLYLAVLHYSLPISMPLLFLAVLGLLGMVLLLTHRLWLRRERK
jgi:hypothetical protein